MSHAPIPSCRRLIAGAAILILVLTTGCSQRETAVQKATRDGIMLVGNGAEPSDLDPQIIAGVPENNIVLTLFEGLTRNDPRTLEARPGVAERWDVSPDGRCYTFHLRRDARWSDGTRLTARDFQASFQRVLSPQLASDNADQLYHVVNAEAYHKGTLKDFSQVGFSVVDDTTLEIRLRYPVPFLPESVAARSWMPVPLHVIVKYGDPLLPGNPWTRPGHIVGNGPFVLKAWAPNRAVEVARNPFYWNRAQVRLRGVRFIPIESAWTEETAFRAGQLHKTSTVPLAKIPVYQREAPQLLHIHPYSGVYYLNFNVRRPPFDNVLVRRALAMAVDREGIVRRITRGGEQPAWHFTPEGIGGYVGRARTRLDFAAARKLLAEAGYPGGRGLPPVTLLYNTAENNRVIVEAIQQTWKRELGAGITLENQEWKVYLDNLQHGYYQICRAGLIMEPYDPSVFLRVFIQDSGYNNTGWSDPEYDRLYDELMHTGDHARRQEVMQRMEKILTDAMPILPIYYYTRQYLLSPAVHGWEDNLLGNGPFDRAWLE